MIISLHYTETELHVHDSHSMERYYVQAAGPGKMTLPWLYKEKYITGSVTKGQILINYHNNYNVKTVRFINNLCEQKCDQCTATVQHDLMNDNSQYNTNLLIKAIAPHR